MLTVWATTSLYLGIRKVKTKQMYALGILVVVVTIGVGLWVILQPQQIEPIKKYVTTPLKKNNVTEIAETIEKTGPKKEATPEERALKRKRDVPRFYGVCRC